MESRKESVYMRAYAKVNLCLHVVGKRPDGYHELQSVMQTVNLYDGIYLKKVPKDHYLKMVTNLRHLPVDKRNIVYKAIEAMREDYGIGSGIFADIRKFVPVSAGLGGGSSDGAAALLGMRRLFRLPLSIEELMQRGRDLGADVPFFFTHGTALAEGIGEKLTPLPPVPLCWFVLVRPPLIISTAEVFKKYPMSHTGDAAAAGMENIARMRLAIETGDLMEICRCFHNDLEAVTAEEYAVIPRLKDELRENGALGALMSGSGPTVFGCFDQEEAAVRALACIRKVHPDIRESFVVRACNQNLI